MRAPRTCVANRYWLAGNYFGALRGRSCVIWLFVFEGVVGGAYRLVEVVLEASVDGFGVGMAVGGAGAVGLGVLPDS